MPTFDSNSHTISEQFFESAPGAIVVTDSQGKIVRLNAQAERMFGYSRSELLGQSIEILVPERFRNSHLPHRQEYRRHLHMRATATRLELYAQRKGGSEFPADIMLSPLNGENGHLVMVVFHDVTAQKRAEKTLQEKDVLLEQVFESSKDAILLLNSFDGRILRANVQAEKMSGYGRGELIGQQVELLIAERSRCPHWPGRDAYRTEGHQLADAVLEIYAKRKNGEEFPVEVALSPVEIPEAELVLALARDVTKRRRAEEALRRSEELFRSLVEGLRDYAIFMLDPEGRVASWNAGAERIKGYQAPEIIGQHFSRLYTEEEIERRKPEQLLKSATARGRYEDEGWRVRKDGSQYWANVIVTALRDKNGQLLGFSVVTRDFTERKLAEESLVLELTNALVEDLDIRRLFASIAAGVRKVMPYDYASLALYDAALKKLRLYYLDFPAHKQPPEGEILLPLEGSSTGRAFTTGERIVLNQMEKEAGSFAPKTVRRWTELGIKSACWLPLINRGQALGTLIVGSERESAFHGRQVRLLTHVANQIAVALNNAEAFRKITELKENLAEKKLHLERELRTEHYLDEIVGESRLLKRVLEQVKTVAPTDATILILGETGTGKELIARAIHTLSGRRDRPFVKLNCAAIPSGLLESELFGHEKGAFTGAISRKIGRFELAHRGTLFLDEVGDIPLELQPKLLRALQEKEFERLGSTRTIPVDVRLIAATNRDLAQMVKERYFRSDLYYRLRVIPVEIPPLRKRPEDIPILIHHFAQKHARRLKKHIEIIPPESIEALRSWHWPGNIRELENLIERAVILSPGPILRIPLTELKSLADHEPVTRTTLEAVEREHIIRVLRATRGAISGPDGAATRLGLNRTTLNSKMKKLGISRHDF